MKCAMQLEAGFQLSEGVNMTRKVNINECGNKVILYEVAFL